MPWSNHGHFDFNIDQHHIYRRYVRSAVELLFTCRDAGSDRLHQNRALLRWIPRNHRQHVRRNSTEPQLSHRFRRNSEFFRSSAFVSFQTVYGVPVRQFRTVVHQARKRTRADGSSRIAFAETVAVFSRPGSPWSEMTTTSFPASGCQFVFVAVLLPLDKVVAVSSTLRQHGMRLQL